MRWIATKHLKTDPDLAGLFTIGDAELEAVAQSMRARGFDPAEPLVVWDGLSTIVDGHTRLAAAKAVGLQRVFVDERAYEDKRAALEYAIARQRDRRNLSRKELSGCVTRAIAALDRVKTAGRPGGDELASRDANSGGKSATDTAEKVGTSTKTVERARAVLASEDEETKTALLNGQTTVNGAYRAVKDAESARQDSAEPLTLSVQSAIDLTAPPPILSQYSAADWQVLSVAQKAAVVEFAPLSEAGLKAGFNQVNENIDWAKWSWNPITGCLHNCDYCYARDIAERWYAQKFVPTFIPARLAAPTNMKLPTRTDAGWRNVFVCSMADLFGKWVPQEWIDAVFERIVATPQWNYLCLTKFPQRLAELHWPDNAWCGTTVDRQYRVEIAERSFRDVRAGVKWLSCEPLLERLTFGSLEMFDWVVIGASSKSTQTPEFQPPWEWVEHLIAQARAAGCKVYMKPNLKSRAQEYPEAVASLL